MGQQLKDIMGQTQSFQISVEVSVIIPTYNAGNEFNKLIGCLKNQKMINKLEIIVIDSESTDGTVQSARKNKVNLIEINRSQFTHSFSRNLGAEKAKYKYIVFMTQDAFPEDSFWLFRILQPLLENDDIVASTCIEKPRKTADLFSRMSIEQQAQWLGAINQDKILQLPREIKDTDSYETVIRKNACLNDVACAYKKEIFLKYKYRLGYAEDLDMGKRLIEAGYKLSLLGKTKIIHSHSRSGLYYLKRMVVERMAYVNIFDGLEITAFKEEELICGIVWLYYNLLEWIDKIMKIPLVTSKFSILLKIQEQYALCTSITYGKNYKYIFMDTELDEFVKSIQKIYHILPEQNKKNGEKIYPKIHDLYKDRVDGLIGYLWKLGDGIITEIDKEEICKAMCCLFGTLVGTLWGDSILEIRELNYLKRIHETLCNGV